MKSSLTQLGRSGVIPGVGSLDHGQDNGRFRLKVSPGRVDHRYDFNRSGDRFVDDRRDFGVAVSDTCVVPARREPQRSQHYTHHQQYSIRSRYVRFS